MRLRRHGAEAGAAPLAPASYLDWAAAGRSTVPRYLVGLGLLVAALVGSQVLPALLLGLLGAAGPLPLPAAVAAAGVSGAVLAAAVLLVTARVLRRPAWSCALPAPRFDGPALALGAGAATAAGLVVTAAYAALVPGAVALRVPAPGAYLPVLAAALVAVPLQAASEDLLFWGYLTQFGRRVTAWPLLYRGVPALLFALPHIGNVAGLGGGLAAALPYLLLGALFGWAAWRSGALWLAIGVHAAHNLFGVVVAGSAGDVLPTVAPLVLQRPGLALTLAGVGLEAALTWLLLRWALRHRPAPVAAPVAARAPARGPDRPPAAGAV